MLLQSVAPFSQPAAQPCPNQVAISLRSAVMSSLAELMVTGAVVVLSWYLWYNFVASSDVYRTYVLYLFHLHPPPPPHSPSPPPPVQLLPLPHPTSAGDRQAQEYCAFVNKTLIHLICDLYLLGWNPRNHKLSPPSLSIQTLHPLLHCTGLMHSGVEATSCP